jgi:hypothetical protein
MATTTQENNNVKAAQLLSTLLDKVDNYDEGFSTLSELHAARIKPLEALRAAGFKAVQSGKAVRYNPNAAPLANEYPYTVAISEFEARFNKRWDSKLTPSQLEARRLGDPKYSPTKKQLDDNNKQKIASLNYWLLNGKFTTNIGKDKPKLEAELAAERFSEATLEAVRANTKAKIAIRQSAENKKLVEQATKTLAKTVAKVKELSASGDIEALKVIEAKAKLERSNLAKLKDNLKIAEVESKKAATAKNKADKAAEATKQAAADKAAAELEKKNKAADMKKLATELSNKYTAEQITKLIVELQKTI